MKLTVRAHARKRRSVRGLGVGAVSVPQVRAPGQTGEVDWGEADCHPAGARTRVHLLFTYSCFSGAACSIGSPVETQ